MHSIDMLVPPTDNKDIEEVEKNNSVDFSEISASFKEVVENQKEVNEQLTNSLNEVVNKLTSTENIKESEVEENEWC
mgnify:CR=1 FL=1